MGITHPVVAVIIEVRGPKVMDGATLEIREDVDFVHCIGPSLGVDMIIGEMLGRVEPLKLGFYSTAAFVKAGHLCLLYELANFFDRIVCRFSRSIHRVDDGTRRPGCAQKIVKSFGSALVGE